ncbi:MAG TPA: RNA 2',3'-cyclic phosphodiesterase [Syntrophomonadaceae bacterium]|nr:RNA 2',3'-cyclic phosphodiesterase [Syntrophomonadaceae bacterium]
MRLFVAIPVSQMVREYAAAIRSELEQSRPDVKWVEAQNYHLTLKFLGEVKADNLKAIQAKLQMAAQACPPFGLETRGVGFFPNSNRPRVIWAGIRGEMDKSEFLGERIDTYLAELGFDPEKKRSFHLTLGRVRSELGLKELCLKTAGVNKCCETISFPVDRFLLMVSKLTPRGPQYSILESYFLEG